MAPRIDSLVKHAVPHAPEAIGVCHKFFQHKTSQAELSLRSIPPTSVIAPEEPNHILHDEIPGDFKNNQWARDENSIKEYAAKDNMEREFV